MVKRLVVLLLSVVAAVHAADTLLLVQVMHRHGARFAITTDNATTLCGSTRECGQLNEQGREMLVGLGSYLNTKYNDFLGQPTQYSQIQSYTRSTRLDRTLQSADGVLRGLYPDMSHFFPVVNTVEFESDLLLLVDAQMSFHIPDRMNEWPGYSLQNDAAFNSIFTHDTLRAMGRETLQYGLCVLDNFDWLAYLKCGLRLQDVAASLRAVGQLPAAQYPVTSAQWDNLCALRRAFHTQLFTFDPSNADQVARGNLGFNLASTIAANMYSATGWSTPLPTGTMIFDYSAHDTTYMPLASAIGHNTAEYMLPAFGQAFIFETWSSVNGPYVRLYGGAPPQTAGPYVYNITELDVYGMKADGTTYASQGPATPVLLADFSRFVNSSKPGNTRGSCYLPKKMLEKLDCDVPAAATDKNCIEYRTWCNQNGCPDEYVMNLVDLSCVPIHPKQLMTTGSAATMVVASLAAGLLVGGGVMQLVHFLRAKKAADQHYENVE